jgi:hypothetical protein
LLNGVLPIGGIAIPSASAASITPQTTLHGGKNISLTPTHVDPSQVPSKVRLAATPKGKSVTTNYWSISVDHIATYCALASTGSWANLTLYDANWGVIRSTGGFSGWGLVCAGHTVPNCTVFYIGLSHTSSYNLWVYRY